MARGLDDVKINHRYFCVVMQVERVKDLFTKRTDKRIIFSVTSHHTVCATARRDLIRAYFE